MKKRLIILSIVLIITIFALYFIFSPVKLGLPSTYKINNNLVDVTLKDNNNKEITFLLTNKSEETLYYGREYRIEKQSFGIWRHILPKKEPTFKLMAYELSKNESKEIHIEWDYLYGILPKGKYRIIKDISTIENKEKNFYIDCYFEINKS